MIKKTYYKIYRVFPEPTEYFYLENVSGGNNTISLKKKGNNAPYLTSVEYSTDGKSWTTATVPSTDRGVVFSVTVPSSGKLYLRGTEGKWNTSSSSTNRVYFETTGSYNTGGDVRTLLNYNDVENVSLYDYCFAEMFCSYSYSSPNNTLRDASNLKLPSKVLAKNCYYSMFQRCTSLTQAPSTLPATELADSCYFYMFDGCTSLTQAPELPATKLVDFCYFYMFQGCTSLTQAPELPATELADYCYQYMFDGCTSLNYVKHNITNWNTTNSQNWLKNVSSTGTMVCPSDSTIPTDSVSGIPTGWTRQNI